MFLAPVKPTDAPPRHGKRRPLALAIQVLVAGGLSIAIATPEDAHAQSRSQQRKGASSRQGDAFGEMRHYDILGGPLSQVIMRFASESRIYIAGISEATQGKTSSGVHGRFTPAGALDVILEDTGLQAIEDAPGQYRLQPITSNTTSSPVDTLPAITVTAEQALRQAPGVSTITQEDIEKRPPANDLSELIRTQPGVNLTGSGSSGSYGNNRQIDLRGMGPENTMILIDGKPVHSRDAVRMQRNGERDSRGDTNWVPAEAVESIEVIRGPAAARYGSGAAGGVVNILTKKPGKTFSGSITSYVNKPEDNDEGGTNRLGFNLAGPISDALSFRLYGNVAKTDSDAPNINAGASGTALTATTTPPAGREGVRNRDINALLRWDLTPSQVLEFEAGASRQGNIYTGERPVSESGTALGSALAQRGAETNITHRNTASVTHRGKWGDLGSSRLLFQYENTKRQNYPLQNFGAGGDIANDTSMIKSELENYFLNGELYTPLKLGGLDHVLTSGFEWRKDVLDDPDATSVTGAAGAIPGVATGAARSGRADARTYALYLEDNISIGAPLVLTPGVRLDHHELFGSNWSPSLNATYELTPRWTIKGGVARAFKAPNLYQSNPNYLFYSNGNACTKPSGTRPNGCYIQGNADLEPETSINSEVGITYNNQRGFDAGVSYFHNDYKNKIHADIWDQPTTVIPGATAGRGSGELYHWVNAKKALVRGFEGTLNIPLVGKAGRTLKWLNNFTYMIENKNKQTNQPLSIIPKYTVNSTLDWRFNERASAQFIATFYGKQKSRTLSSGYGLPVSQAQDRDVGTYAIYGVGITYQVSKNLRAGAGVRNLFDKRLYRGSTSDGAGANTYNEPGRAYYVTLTGSF